MTPIAPSSSSYPPGDYPGFARPAAAPVITQPIRTLAARLAATSEGGSELGLTIFGPPLVLLGYYLVVEAGEVTLHLNHRSAAVPGSERTIKAAEATEASPALVLCQFAPASVGELVAIAKAGAGSGAPFVNLTAVLG